MSELKKKWPEVFAQKKTWRWVVISNTFKQVWGYMKKIMVPTRKYKNIDADNDDAELQL